MPVLRFFALQVAIGFGIAALLLAALLLADLGGIGSLLRSSKAGLWPVLLFWLFTGLSFGAVQFAVALGLAAEHEPRAGRGRLLADPAYAVARAVRRPRNPSP
jgi:predicted lipid-binding transport protein (Tim44 family)